MFFFSLILTLLHISHQCISDTHGLHRQLNIPDGDILIHAGDFTHYGKRRDADDFNAWLGTLPHKHKIVINGNHEFRANWQADRANKSVEADPTVLSNATHLVQRGVSVMDGKLKVFGCQFQSASRSDGSCLAEVPAKTDIVVTHFPPKGFVDGGVGCVYTMREILCRIKPKVVVCGHIHTAHGIEEAHGILFVNAAICNNEKTAVDYQPIVFTI